MKPHATPAATRKNRVSDRVTTGPSFPIGHKSNPEDGSMHRVDLTPDVISGVFGEVTPVLAAAVPQTNNRRDEQTRLLRQAGYLARSAYIDFAAIRYAITICSILVLGTALVVVTPLWEPFVVGGLVTIPFLMWLVPASVVERQAAHRKEQIARGVPDLMSLIRLFVEQGMDVPVAFEHAGRELRGAYPAIAVEAAMVSIQADVSDFSHALRTFRDRIDVAEIDTLTSMLIQSSELGSGVCESLEKNSRNLRQLQAEKRCTIARLTPRRIIVPTLFFLVPAVVLVVYAPSIVEYLSALDAAVINSQFGR